MTQVNEESTNGSDCELVKNNGIKTHLERGKQSE